MSIAKERDHLMPVYNPPELLFERGEGPYLYEKNGGKWLDFIAGIAVCSLGHAHPTLIKALHEQAQKLWHTSNMFHIEGQVELANRYCESSFADRCFFTNSGTEAVEMALKAARRYHYERDDKKRTKLVSFEGAFHGRSMAAISVGGRPQYKEGFEPLLGDTQVLPFFDMKAIEVALDDNTAAVIVEPLQGEGGVSLVPDEDLKRLRELCNERGILLIYDEIQSGFGRTGKLYAHEWVRGAQPDIMTLAKGIGGGFPLGACLCSEEVAQAMQFGSHGSTYGGNPLAMAVGIAAYDIIAQPEFLETLRRRAANFEQKLAMLRDQHAGLLLEIRGRGLLRGFVIDEEQATNKEVLIEARKRGLLIGAAGDNVIRFAPPLNIEEDHLTEAVNILDETFTQFA